MCIRYMSRAAMRMGQACTLHSASKRHANAALPLAHAQPDSGFGLEESVLVYPPAGRSFGGAQLSAAEAARRGGLAQLPAGGLLGGIDRMEDFAYRRQRQLVDDMGGC